MENKLTVYIHGFAKTRQTPWSEQILKSDKLWTGDFSFFKLDDNKAINAMIKKLERLN